MNGTQYEKFTRFVNVMSSAHLHTESATKSSALTANKNNNFVM